VGATGVNVGVGCGEKEPHDELTSTMIGRTREIHVLENALIDQFAPHSFSGSAAQRLDFAKHPTCTPQGRGSRSTLKGTGGGRSEARRKCLLAIGFCDVTRFAAHPYTFTFIPCVLHG
jgi:hypothetical protein